MKIRTLIRVTKDYQVSEAEMEMELPETSDSVKTMIELQDACIVHASTGLQKVLGQTNQIPKKPVAKAGIVAKTKTTNMSDLV